jgi:hypothetical protein
LSLIACLSGPERTRANVDVALEDARIPHLPDDHHGMMDWTSKLPPYASEEAEKQAKKHKHHGPQGFVTVHVADADGLNAAVSAVEPHGWALRVHYPEPPKPEPSPERQIAATLADMRAEIDALKAKVGA